MQINISDSDEEDWKTVRISQEFNGKAPPCRYAVKLDAQNMLHRLYPGVDPSKLRVISV